MAKQKIRIKLKAYDHNLIDKSAERIVETAKRSGAVVSGPIPLPTEKEIDHRVAAAGAEVAQHRLQQGIVQFPADHVDVAPGQGHGLAQQLPVAEVPGEADDPLAFGEGGVDVLHPLDPGDGAHLLRGGAQQAQGAEQHGPEMLEAAPGQGPDGGVVELEAGTAQVLPHHPAVPGVHQVEQPAHAAPQGRGAAGGQGPDQGLDALEQDELEAVGKGDGGGPSHGRPRIQVRERTSFEYATASPRSVRRGSDLPVQQVEQRPGPVGRD